MGEHYLDTVGVGGSIPPAPTKYSSKQRESSKEYVGHDLQLEMKKQHESMIRLVSARYGLLMGRVAKLV